MQRVGSGVTMLENCQQELGEWMDFILPGRAQPQGAGANGPLHCQPRRTSGRWGVTALRVCNIQPPTPPSVCDQLRTRKPPGPQITPCPSHIVLLPKPRCPRRAGSSYRRNLRLYVGQIKTPACPSESNNYPLKPTTIL